MFSQCAAAMHTLPPVTVQCEPMAPHTRLLSNNNDSDLLEISGICPTSWNDYRAQYSTLVGPQLIACTCWQTKAAHAEDIASHNITKRHWAHFFFFALEEIRGVSFSPLARNVVPCRQNPPPTLPLLPPPTPLLNARAVYWYSAAQVSKNAEPFKHLNRCLFCL